MYEMLERNKSTNIVRHNVRHWPPKDSLEIGLILEWYFVVDFEVVFWFYLCLYFLFSITWIIWSRYSKTLIQKVHLTSLLVHINHHIMINLKVSRPLEQRSTDRFNSVHGLSMSIYRSEVGQKSEEELSDLDQLLQEHIQRARHNPGAV